MFYTNKTHRSVRFRTPAVRYRSEVCRRKARYTTKNRVLSSITLQVPAIPGTSDCIAGPITPGVEEKVAVCSSTLDLRVQDKFCLCWH